MSAGIRRSNSTETERSRLALRNSLLALATLRVSTNLQPQRLRPGKEDGAGVVMSDIPCWCVLQSDGDTPRTTMLNMLFIPFCSRRVCAPDVSTSLCIEVP